MAGASGVASSAVRRTLCKITAISTKVAIASAHVTLVSEVLPTNRDTSRVPPLVSIVVPVFNGMPHLVALTDSLLAQTYPDLEIIFSEGGGTDGSMAYLSSIQDPRVRLVSQTQGTSAAQNWTAVTHEARGEFIKLVCQTTPLKSVPIFDIIKNMYIFLIININTTYTNNTM